MPALPASDLPLPVDPTADASAAPLSVTGRRWQLARTDPGDVARLSGVHGLAPLVARVLHARAPAEDLGPWLRPTPDHLHDPYAMIGMEPAVERLRRAVRDGHKVRIVTDYDVDGTTSSLILQGTLRLLGGGDGLSYHIPDRMDEGYGFSERAAQAAIDDGVDLLVTADIGVRDHAAVARAAAGGVDVIVCDHHLPAGHAVPDEALAVLCPPQDGCTYPNPHLAACGVSLKLAQALLHDHPARDRVLRSMLKIAAIGTVADVVSLGSMENRAIVSLGIDALRQDRHSPGLSALLGAAGISYDLSRGWQVEASDLGFRIGPRINAAGRLESATAVIELFDERDPAKARERARALEALNKERQAIQRHLVDQCVGKLGDSPPPFAVLWGPESDGWHRGVVGIVAARIRDRIHRPCAVVAVSGDEARGSVRSVPGIHGVRALDSASDLLIKYGGHPAAAGFSVATSALPELAERLAAYVSQAASDEELVPVLDIDAEADPADLTWDVVEGLLALGPFGKGNPSPRLLVRCTPSQVRTMGQDGKHLSFQAGPVRAVWWNAAEHRDLLSGPVELACTPGLNTWKGRTSRQLRVEDLRPAR